MALNLSAFGIQNNRRLNLPAFGQPDLAEKFGLPQTFLTAPTGREVPISYDIIRYKTGEPLIKVPFQKKLLKPLFEESMIAPDFDRFMNETIKFFVELPEKVVNTVADAGSLLFTNKPTPRLFEQAQVPTAVDVYHNTRQQALNVGYNEKQAHAIGMLGATGSFLVDMGIATQIAEPLARLAVGQLPKNLLVKISTTDIPALEIRGALTGVEGGTERALNFVKRLTVEERRGLFSVLRQAEKTGAPITAITGQEPTALGRFAGIQPTAEPGFARVAPEQQLPGYAPVGEPQPRIGLQIQPVKRVGGIPEIKTKTPAYKRVLSSGYIALRDSWGNEFFQMRGKVPDIVVEKGIKPHERKPIDPTVDIDKLAGEQKSPISLIEVGPQEGFPKTELVRFQTNEGVDVYVNREYLNIVLRNYPNAKFFTNKENNPISLKVGDKVVAIVSPIRDAKIKSPEAIVEKPSEVPVAGVEPFTTVDKNLKKIPGFLATNKEGVKKFFRTKEEANSFAGIVEKVEVKPVIPKEVEPFVTEQPRAVTPEIIKRPETVEDSISRIEITLDAIQATIDDNPASKLWKYANKVNKKLPEILGTRAGGIFKQRGDQLLSEVYGYDVEESKVYEDFDAVVKLREERDVLIDKLKELKKGAKNLGTLSFREVEINPEKIFANAPDILKREVVKELGGKIKVTEKGEKVVLPESINIRTEPEKAAVVKDYLKKLRRDLEALDGILNPNIIQDLNDIGGYNFANLEELKRVLAVTKKTGGVKAKKARRVITSPEDLATTSQVLRAQEIIARKNLSTMQSRRLAKIFTGQSTVDTMSRTQANEFIKSLEGVTLGYGGGQPRLPRTTALLPPGAIPEIAGKMKDIGLGSLFLSPRLVFKNIGKVAFENVFIPMIRGVKEYRKNLSKVKDELVEKQKFLGTFFRFRKFLFRKEYKDQSERLFNYLNDEVKPALSSKEQVVADWAKKLFDKYADRLDVLLAKQGLPPVNRRKNYITNLINEDVVQAIREGKISSEFFAILDDITPKQVFDPYLLAREGKLPIQKDFWKSLNAYIALSEKKLVFDEILPRVTAYTKQLPAEAKKYAEWFTQSIMGKPSDTDRLIRNTLQNWADKIAGNKTIKIPVELEAGLYELELQVPKVRVPTKIASITVGKLKAFNYFSFIGANIRTGLINLTQPISTAANLPRGIFTSLVDISYGYSQAITKIFSKKAWTEMRERGVLTEIERMLEDEFSITGLLGDLTMWNMKISEFMNRVSSTYAAKRAFTKLLARRGIKLAEEEAFQLGRELSDMMNFRYGLGETPKIFKNPIGQLYYQYSTFATKQAELLADMALRTFKKGQIEEFLKAVNEGKGVEYLERQGSPTRTALLRYILYASALIGAVSAFGINMADVFYKGAVPSQVENFIKGTYKLVRGDWFEAMTDFGKMAIPPVIGGLYPSRLVPFPKGFIPAEKQLSRFLLGENIKQQLGFEKIPTRKKELKIFDLPSFKEEGLKLPSFKF